MAKYPIAGVRVESFGPFRQVDVPLAPSLTVIVGDNATGKSQLLKLMYACTKCLKDADSLTKKELNGGIAAKLRGVFRPESLGRLTRRSRGKTIASISVKYEGIAEPLAFDFSSHATREVKIATVPSRRLEDEPVFIPSHELFSLTSSFLGLYNEYETGFEETWKDTVELLLQRPALRGPRGEQANKMLEPFSSLLQGGSVVESKGNLYLKQPGIGSLEAPLLAEGQRKLAMIVRLISNGALLKGGYLFWDEPEANLNPASQRAVAQALILLAEGGAQIVVATHSMFLVRELQMIPSEVQPKYISLARKSDTGESSAMDEVGAQTSDDVDDLEVIASLDAEVEQADRYLAW
ncbi:MAG: ATP-binding protein [Ancrocorticia sp.]